MPKLMPCARSESSPRLSNLFPRLVFPVARNWPRPAGHWVSGRPRRSERSEFRGIEDHVNPTQRAREAGTDKSSTRERDVRGVYHRYVTFESRTFAPSRATHDFLSCPRLRFIPSPNLIFFIYVIDIFFLIFQYCYSGHSHSWLDENIQIRLIPTDDISSRFNCL